MRWLFAMVSMLLLVSPLLVSCEPGQDPRTTTRPSGGLRPPDAAPADGKDATPKSADRDASKDDAPGQSGGQPKDRADDNGAADAQTPTAPPKTNGDAAQASNQYTVLQKRDDRLVVALPNRMIVIAQEIHTAPVVSVQMWVKTGSIYEQEHVGAGLSHFLEHLLSGGTTSTREEAESNRILGEMGARTNAATSLAQVWYYINTTSDHADTAVDLMTDWMRHSVIKQSEYEREQQVIVREFQMGMGEPGRIFWKLMQSARYKAHPARHPTIGYLDEFLKISRDEIYDFYKRMYVPNNMVFVVAGGVDKQKIVEQITALWHDAPTGELPQLSFPVEPPVTEPSEATGHAAIQRPQLRLAWPGTKLAGEGDYAMDLLAVILGQGESSRLVSSVRDRRRLVNSIVAYNRSWTWGQGFFAIDADVAVQMPEGGGKNQPPVPADEIKQRIDTAVEAARAAVIEQVERIKSQGVTPQELARAKRQTIADVVFSAQTAEDLADQLAHFTIGMGDPDYLDRYARAITSVTAGEVKAVANRYLVADKTMKLLLLPSKAPPAPLKRPDDDPAITRLERTPFDLDNAVLIEQIRANAARAAGASLSAEVEPIKHYKLSNGLRLLVGRNTLIPAVAIEMYQLGGLLADDPGLEGIANAAAVMQIKGTKNRTAQEIAAQLEALGAALDTLCGNNTNYIKARCLRQDWPQVLEILADVALNASFPEDEWAIMKPRLQAAIASQSEVWSTDLALKFRNTYFHRHPWQTLALGRGEVVAALTADNLQSFYQKRLSAEESVIAVFGDVDPDAVAKAVERLFAPMPAKAEKPFEAPLPMPPVAGTAVFDSATPTTAVQIGFGPGVDRKHPDYAAIQVLVRVINNFPVGWLEQELRGKGRGIAYAVWAYQSTGVIPGYIAFAFNCKASDVEEGVQRALAVAERARTETVDAETLRRAKAAVLTGEFFNKQSNADRATEAALNELYGLPPDTSRQFIEAVNDIDAEALQAIAAKYLRNPVVVVVKEKAAAQ